jgi:uncharacterized GH25 family protein
MDKKKFAAIALVALMTFGITATALAHDGWSQTNTPIIAQGEVSYVDLLFGNHANEHSSYRITGQWSKDTSKVYVTTPVGKKVDITSTMFYTGEAATETAPAVNNGYLATFSSSAPGAYIISVEADSIYKTTRTLRNAKSFVAVSDIPTLERIKLLKGFSREINSDRAEWVPVFNPAAITPGEQVSVQLLLKGKPLVDTEATLIQRSNSKAQKLKTNAEGIISFKTGSADYYLLRAKPNTDEKKDGEYGATSYEATMTFTVQNGSVKLPYSKVQPVPYVYVNGKLATTPGLSIKAGSTFADAAFIKQYVDATYASDQPGALRTIVESLQGSIEYLPAVGDTRAAVLIYMKE